MVVLFVYLIGCLLSFGLTYSVVIPYKESKQYRVSNFYMYVYGVLGSWLIIVVFIFGMFKSFYIGGK
jgi:hypothetical protein